MKFFSIKKKGQGVLEYVIICSLIGIFCLIAVKTLGRRIDTRIRQMTNKIEKHITDSRWR